MIRNLNRERSQKQIISSPQSLNCVQTSIHAEKQFNIQYVRQPLQKARSTSHKKLSVVSSNSSLLGRQPQPQHNTRIIQPAFDLNRFCKINDKGSMLSHSKKANIQDHRILRIQNQDSKKINQVKILQSTQKQNMPYCLQHSKQDLFKRELKQYLNSKFSYFSFQINNQHAVINQLKSKIQILQKEIANKNQIIKSIRHSNKSKVEENNNFSLINEKFNNYQMIISKINYLENVLKNINSQSTRVQNSINRKLQQITKQMVQITLQKISFQSIKTTMNSLKSKLNLWMQGGQSKINYLYQKQRKTSQKLQQFKCISPNIIKRIANVKKVINNLAKQTKKDEQNTKFWSKFEDFIMTSEEIQVQSIGFLGKKDQFFYPNQDKSPKINISKELSHATSITASSITYSSHQRENQINIFDYFKRNRDNKQPLRCAVDKYNRIINKQTNRLLQHEGTKIYFKVSPQQIKILQDLKYITIEP